MKRIAPFVLLVVSIGIISFFGFGLFIAPDLVKKIDQKAPITKMVNQKGMSLDLEKLVHPIILHFAAAWCYACQDEMPDLVALAAKHHIPLWLVVYDSDPKDVKDSIFADHIIVDRGAMLSLHFGIRALPTSFIVGRGGKIVASITHASDLEKAVHHATNP